VSSSALAVNVAGIDFQNPVLLAAGTAAYGRELASVIDLDALGGVVTKAVSIEPRHGAPSPRVAEIEGGMINAVGLANPGVDAVKREELPWLASSLRRAKVLVNVVGSRTEDFAAVVSTLCDSAAVAGFELNVSCPNVKAGGLEFGADPAALREVVARARAPTTRPIFVKLSPTLADIGRSAQVASDAGANGISVVNTIPGLLIDVDSRRPVLGFGSGGVSGTGLLPVGVLATYRVAKAVKIPVIGVGGVSRATDIVQYVLAGASLVGVGTAVMQKPKLATALVRDLERWCRKNHVTSLAQLRGGVHWEK
jgi:dihydroorotate dehydrogenase (NAD+) catalytic subunit